MKKINFLFGALAALAMGGAVTACSDDDLDKGIDNGVAEVDQTRYLSVAITNPAATSRANVATDFEDGTTDENYIDKLFFVFYDAQGLPTGTPYQLQFTDNENNADGTNNTTTGTKPGQFGDGTTNNVEKIWKSVIPVALAQGANLPSYVMAFVNPISSSDLLTKSMSELQEMKRKRARCDDNHFPMSNSVYYANNEISGETMARMFATPVLSTQLYKSEKEAKDKPTIDVYVERYAAKVKLNVLPTAIANNTDKVNGYELKFIPTAWRPNAIDEETYILKHYGVYVDGALVEKPTFGQLDAVLGSWWNDPDLFRSYWGCSPSYYKNIYPKVSDDVTDNPAGTYNVHYFTYDEIESDKLATEESADKSILQPAIKWDATNGFNTAFYARETTAALKSWKDASTSGYNPLATMASIVIAGKYEVYATGSTTPLTLTDGFWLFGKTGGKWNLYKSKDEVKVAIGANQNVVLKNISTTDVPNYQPIRIGDPNAENAAANIVAGTYFNIEHPSKEVRTAAKTTVAGRLVALQLNETVAGSGLYWYNNGNYELITTTNLNAVNAALLTAGYATQYGKNLCYFNIPIEHLGIYESATGATGTYVEGAKNADGTYNFNSCPAGSFGLVRNHVYNINVSKISGLATALRDENQPIVPPVDEVEYHIAAKLNVLSWRIVPTQNVIL